MSLKYRKEIDGLRAVAVIPVIFFHAGAPGFEGGYLGVDIFFVISGYLITTIILREIADGNFSIAQFYERRARRILPALFFVILLTIPLSFLLMTPGQFDEFGRSLPFVALFASNVFFWRSSGYFGEGPETNPLIHTWSLSVEEQFYIGFPFLILLLWRFGLFSITCVIIPCSLLSLGLSQWASDFKPAANFFLTPMRVWELFAGSLCALFLFRRRQKPNEFLAALGFLLLASAMATFDATTPTPSVITLWPVVGVCLLIIFCHEETVIGRLLSIRPIVFIGLISYSAYLFHQPTLAFLRLLQPDPATWMVALAVGAVFPMAYFSWRFVEQPFRRRYEAPRIARGRLPIFGGAAVGAAIIVGAGVAIDRSEGFPQRLTAEQRAILAFTRYERRDEVYRYGTCFLDPNDAVSFFAEECSAPQARFAIWGDSHAAALSAGFREASPSFAQYTSGSCAPILNVDSWGRRICIERNAYAFSEISRTRPETLVMHGSWSGYIDDPRILAAFKESLRAALEASPTTRILLVGSVPIWRPSLPELYVRTGRDLRDTTHLQVESLLYRRLRAFDSILEDISLESPRIDFVSILDLICEEGGNCRSSVERDGVIEPLNFDGSHLTRNGSVEIASKILTAIEN